MNHFFRELLLYTGVISLAVIIGGILPVLKDWKRQHLPLVLSLSAGLMLGSAFFHLIPDAYNLVGQEIGIYIIAGFLFLFFIEKYITVHICEAFDCEVHKLGISAFIGISLHTFTDGIALGSSLMVPGLGFVVFLAIVAHKAPEVFTLTGILLHSETRKSKIILINLLILLTIPLGALFAYGVLKPENQVWVGRAIAFSSGTFLHISLSDLLPEAHKHSQSKILASLLLLLGLGFMWAITKHVGVH